MFKPFFALTILASAGFVGPAWAHAHLQRAVPAEHAQERDPPDAVALGFTQEIEAKLSTIAVRTAAGGTVTAGPAEHVGGDRKTLRVSLPKLTPGVYTVEWSVVSVDTHRVTGKYSFTVKP